ncbi:MAG: DNA photolyase [Desulfobacterales bacterium C00003060]|nr:MAG: DNA photolyase [Desulfobacterales bacterium S3730MH5]OEU77603.1 MAG: DNA photolyase [Desulfobacterales bacterium C00003060]OEU82526.1 MAG: DNA photolyase [Desulfobacterales bacterium S5133MH4]
MISKLYIDETVKHHPAVGAVQASLPAVPVSVVPDAVAVHEALAAKQDPIAAGKRVLFLTRNKGPFLKKCPGTKSYICCGYQILHIGTYCTMDCAYCILQAYFHPPVLQFFVNQERLFKELDDLVRSGKPPFRRVGTGEFTDSLIWDPWTQLSRALVPYFAQQHRVVLELKTKTTAIDNLRGLEHQKKTIVAWSLNSPAIIRSEEHGTASMRARLRAAAQCEAWGYPLAFHFDPLILYDGWEEDYKRLVRELFATVSAQNIVWISLGSFRFMPSLKPIIQKRFKKSRIIYGEFIPGLDGKMRYFKPLRINLYEKMAAWIRELAPDVMLYFCMEDQQVWERALGFVPEDRGGLSKMLDQSAARHCGVY